ncbi:hypothetical protein BJF90_40595 [Pseudonocardia sp. CNS-004]|nr:hypothetical protein BJF90_40595 [Pseudonocardia sp. CNS-004]
MRGIDRVEEALHAGPDAEVDDKWLHVRPGDPARTAPFLVLAQDRISAPGYEWHPHRGIETVTVVLDGALVHEDDAGGSGVLRAGDAQWMTAGRGIVHREVAAPGAPAHVLQLWLDLRPAPGRRCPVTSSCGPRIARGCSGRAWRSTCSPGRWTGSPAPPGPRPRPRSCWSRSPPGPGTTSRCRPPTARSPRGRGGRRGGRHPRAGAPHGLVGAVGGHAPRRGGWRRGRRLLVASG